MRGRPSAAPDRDWADWAVQRGTGRRARPVPRSRLHATHALPPHMGVRASDRRIRAHRSSATKATSSSTISNICACMQSAVCCSQRSAATPPATRAAPELAVRKCDRWRNGHRSRTQRVRAARAVARASRVLERMRCARERARARRLADMWQAGRAGTGRWRRRTRAGPDLLRSFDLHHILEHQLSGRGQRGAM